MRTVYILSSLLLVLFAPVVQAFFSEPDVYDDANADFSRQMLFLPEITAAAIAIDGKADESAWQQAVTLGNFQQVESALPIPDEIDTKVRILRAAEGVYVAVTGRRAPLPPAYKGRDGKVDPDNPELQAQGLDTLALQFNGNVQDFTRYRFGITATGQTFTLRHFVVPAWKPEGWSAAYHATDTTIAAEFYIPYNLIRDAAPTDGDVIAFNVLRYANTYTPVPGGPFRYAISNTYALRSALCHSVAPVDHFPWLYFGSEAQWQSKRQPVVARLYLDKTVYRTSDENAEAYIEARGLRDYNLHVVLTDEAGKTIHERQYPAIGLPDVGFAFDVRTLAAGPYTLRAMVVKEGDQVAVAQRAFTVEADNFKPIKLPEAVDLVLTSHPDLGTGMRSISTGIPLPRGAVFDDDLDNITVERRMPTGENPEQPWLSAWQPIDTQLEVRNRWYRDGSIRWLGIDFDAEYFRGAQRALHMTSHPYHSTYRVSFKTPRPKVENPLTVHETADVITVNTGPLSATISKKHFQLLTEASVNGVQLIRASKGDGLLHVDQDGHSLTTAHDATRVWVERVGPMSAVICAEGWYARDGQREGKHITRMFFDRGKSFVRVHHTYIVTVDTRKKTIRNIAIRLGVPSVRQYDLEHVNGKGEARLLQYRHNQYVVEKPNGDVIGRGDRAAGRAVVTTAQGKVQIAARRFWQSYPNELEITSDGIALHTWPAHGREVFTDDEITAPLGVAQALFAHHGQQLNFRVPDACYETMGKAYSKHLTDRGYDKIVGPSIAGFKFTYAHEAWQANAQGMAFTTEFVVRLYDGETPIDADFAPAFEADAHAVADPKWTHRTGVFGELWPEDNVRFGAAERWVALRYREMMIDGVERLGDYGKVNWPDIHQYPGGQLHGDNGAGFFHRTWTGTHYQEGRTFYQLYLRSGDHGFWQYARDSARQKMDVSTVNYAGLPRVGNNQTPFGSYHVYGMYAWAGMQGISCHYQNHDYKSWETFLTGDPRGKQQALGWAREMARATWATESTRDAAVTLSEALEVYQATRYAPLLKTVHWFKEAVVAVPIEQFVLPHYSQMVWTRAHEYTRDPRVAERLVEQWGDGEEAKRHGLGSAHTMLTLYRITGDKRILALMSFVPPRPNPMIPNQTPPALTRVMMNYPYAMSGLAEVAAPGAVLIDRGAHQGFWKPYLEQWKSEGKKIWGVQIK